MNRLQNAMPEGTFVTERPPLEDQIDSRIARIKQERSKVERLKKLLEENPDLRDALDLLLELGIR